MENWSLLLSGAVLIFLRHSGRPFSRDSPQSAAFNVAAFCIYLKSAETHRQPSQSNKNRSRLNSRRMQSLISPLSLCPVQSQTRRGVLLWKQRQRRAHPSQARSVLLVFFFLFFFIFNK